MKIRGSGQTAFQKAKRLDRAALLPPTTQDQVGNNRISKSNKPVSGLFARAREEIGG